MEHGEPERGAHIPELMLTLTLTSRQMHICAPSPPHLPHAWSWEETRPSRKTTRQKKKGSGGQVRAGYRKMMENGQSV